MSSSETPRGGGQLLELLDELHRHIEEMSTTDALPQELTAASTSRLVADAARLYSASCVAAGRELDVDHEAVSATQAIMLINALMQCQNLNTFDLALWRIPDQRPSTDRTVQHR